MSEHYWQQLTHSLTFIEALYKKHKVILPPNEGLRAAIDEAKSFVAGVKMSGNPTESEIAVRAEKTNAIIMLADTLRPLDAAGIAITRYLKQIGTGSTNYGTPQLPGQSKTHFFKDFETELFVLAALIKAKAPVALLPDPSDPVGEMVAGGVFIEVKHPDAPNQVEKLIGKFNGELARHNAYGVFVLALEDAFETASQSIHASQEDRDTAFHVLAKKIDSLARTVLPRAARLPYIGGCVTLLSRQEVIEGNCSFRRLANALVFDERSYPPGVRAAIDSICGVFAQPPGLFSKVKARLVTSPNPPKPQGS